MPTERVDGVRTAVEMEHALSGKAVTTGDGMLHIEREVGTTMCGEAVESYPLHWDVTTWIACGICLIEAGVPLYSRQPNSQAGPDEQATPR